MPRRGTNLFNRNDLRRAIRSAQEMGLSVHSFKIGRDGEMIFYTRRSESGEPGAAANPWDAETAKLQAKAAKK
jgi:hypothetical protein